MNSRTGWIGLATAAAAVAAIWVSSASRVADETEAALATAHRANANLAIAYEESTAAALGDVEQMLRLLDIEYGARGGEIAQAVSRWPIDGKLLRSMAVYDASGRLVFTSAPGHWERLAGPALLRAADGRREGGHTLHVGRPQALPDGTGWSMRVWTPLRGAGTAGVAVADVDPARFVAFYQRADLGARGIIMLLGDDGVSRVRQIGATASYGEDMRGAPLLRELARRPSGDFVTVGRLDGTVRLASYRRLAGYPLSIMVGTDRREALAGVAERRKVYYGVAAIATLLIALVTVALSRAAARQKRDLAALARSQQDLRAVVDCANDGIVTYDEALLVTGANRAAERILGLCASEVIGKPGFTSLLTCVHEDGRPLQPEQRPTRMTRATGIPVTGRVIGIERPECATQWISVSTAPIQRPDAPGLLGLVSTISDVTAQRAAEEAMRENEARYRATFNQALVGIAHATPDGRLLRVNDKLCEMLGYPREELVGREVPEITHEEDRPATLRLMQTLLQRADFPAVRPELRRLRRKDGGLVWTLASVALVHKADGSPDYFLGMVQDVTELKRIDQMKDEFISSVSHELRTPLTSIRGSLGLIAAGAVGAVPARAAELVRIASDNCERLVLLVNDILDIEKMESGRMRFDLQPLDLGKLLEEAVVANEGYARVHGARLALSLPTEPVQVVADAHRLHQAVTNLVSNAVKYSPANEEVTVSLRSAGGTARIEVSDRGPGIPAEFRARIFAKFSQADGSDAREKCGTGLGLCIAKGLVERMGGEIGYRSEAGAGTTFYIDMPAASPEAADASAPALQEA